MTTEQICQTYISPKKEPLDFAYTPPPAPLDLCVRNAKRPMTPSSHILYPIPDFTCSSPFRNYDDKQRRTSLGSSPRSNSSGESSELSSTTCDNLVGFTKFAPLAPRTKATRPFKAYPKDPMSLAIGASAVDIVMGNLGSDSADSYAEFRAKMLEQVQAQHSNTTNKNMRRNNNNGSSQIEDPTYWEKRRKNNEAAKRSRDARRAKEDEIAIRCAFLEHEHIRMKHENLQLKHENVQLKFRLAAAETEMDRLKNMMYH
ncbi:hypothetical protein HHI36_011620 [Cryptolaemus montrouzieri]|uniref:BZIP domain-containing protein n=1 Tax=Cryptolaemus montrouzieri TaxID=559131 RepID=A0ABD2MMD2_9CUCU